MAGIFALFRKAREKMKNEIEKVETLLGDRRVILHSLLFSQGSLHKATSQQAWFPFSPPVFFLVCLRWSEVLV